MTQTVQMQQMKIKKKTETEAFQKLAKGNLWKKKKLIVEKPYIQAITIMKIIIKNPVYILGDSIVKKLSGYLLTEKIRHKYLVKVCSFSGTKINCMTD